MARLNAAAVVASNSRGSALWETLLIIPLLLVLTSGALIVAYMAAGRSWLWYLSEQTLFCLSEERSSAFCRRQLLRRSEAFLPWGEIHARVSSARQPEIHLHWRLGGGVRIVIHRRLDLRSSALSRSHPSWSP